MDRKPRKPRIQALIDAIDGGRVLHIGAVGHGNPTHPDKDWTHGYLDEVADELVGIDTNAIAVTRLQENGYDLRYDQATELNNVEGPFDTVVAPEVIEHLSSPGRLFTAVTDVVADDGTLLITTPNPWGACYVKRMALGVDPVGNNQHTCWIDATTLRELSSRHGYYGCIEHLPPMSGGLTNLCYQLGHTRLGSTRLFGSFRLSDEYKSE